MPAGLLLTSRCGMHRSIRSGDPYRSTGHCQVDHRTTGLGVYGGCSGAITPLFPAPRAISGFNGEVTARTVQALHPTDNLHKHGSRASIGLAELGACFTSAWPRRRGPLHGDHFEMTGSARLFIYSLLERKFPGRSEMPQWSAGRACQGKRSLFKFGLVCCTYSGPLS